LILTLASLLLFGIALALVISFWVVWRARFGWYAGLITTMIASLWCAGVLLVILSYTELGWLLQASAFIASLVLRWRGSSRIISQQAEIERLKRIAESRADRISVLSHEVRTPLALIKAAAELLGEKTGPLTQQQRVFLDTIQQNCERTIALAEDLLTQARIEAGLFKVNLQPTDLKALTRQVTQGLKPLLAQKNQTIKLDYPQMLPPMEVDEHLIHQALTNLLTNASRHTSPGGHIFVTLADSEQAVIVSITDDGAGMTAEERKRLFQRFSSGHPLGDGTGLGLVIVKQIIKLHGGVILVDTNLGRGTSFLFTLPRLIEKEKGGAGQVYG
jgi:two-component system, OmpR family, sensor kinase